MTKYSGRDRGEYEFTRAAYDELRDLEVSLGLYTTVCLSPTEQKGVWRLELTTWTIQERPGRSPVATYKAFWPNVESQTFGACFYAASHRQARMCEAWAVVEGEIVATG